jgi:hypothetical protein
VPGFVSHLGVFAPSIGSTLNLRHVIDIVSVFTVDANQVESQLRPIRGGVPTLWVRMSNHEPNIGAVEKIATHRNFLQ